MDQTNKAAIVAVVGLRYTEEQGYENFQDALFGLLEDVSRLYLGTLKSVDPVLALVLDLQKTLRMEDTDEEAPDTAANAA